MTKVIKAILKKYNIKNSTRTERSFIRITTEMIVSEDVRKELRALETYESHGNMMNDTHYSTGKMILINGGRA